jgi:hypothetical protein
VNVTNGRKAAFPHHVIEGRCLLTTYSLLHFYPEINNKMVSSGNNMVNTDMVKRPLEFPQRRLKEILFVKENESIFHNAISYDPPN